MRAMIADKKMLMQIVAIAASAFLSARADTAKPVGAASAANHRLRFCLRVVAQARTGQAIVPGKTFPVPQLPPESQPQR